MKDNLYQILHVDPYATDAQIRAAYHILVARCFAGSSSSSDKATVRQLEQIETAFAVLSDSEQRKAYDLANGWALTPAAEAERAARQAAARRESRPPAANPHDPLPRISNETGRRCECCGLPAPTRWVQFDQNVSGFFVRYPTHVQGNFCRNCIGEYFWTMTGKTMFMGWFGMISSVIAPMYIFGNVVTYLGALGLPRPDRGRPAKINGWKIAVLGIFLLILVGIGWLAFLPH